MYDYPTTVSTEDIVKQIDDFINDINNFKKNVSKESNDVKLSVWYFFDTKAAMFLEDCRDSLDDSKKEYIDKVNINELKRKTEMLHNIFNHVSDKGKESQLKDEINNFYKDYKAIFIEFNKENDNQKTNPDIINKLNDKIDKSFLHPITLLHKIDPRIKEIENAKYFKCPIRKDLDKKDIDLWIETDKLKNVFLDACQESKRQKRNLEEDIQNFTLDKLRLLIKKITHITPLSNEYADFLGFGDFVMTLGLNEAYEVMESNVEENIKLGKASSKQISIAITNLIYIYNIIDEFCQIMWPKVETQTRPTNKLKRFLGI